MPTIVDSLTPSAQPALTSAVVGPRRSTPPTRLRVLVADDHPLYRQGIVRALESSGEFEVVGEAADGATALARIRREKPDVAVLDVRMPGMDGIDVVAALARHGPAVPVVLLSAFDDTRMATAGLEAGAAAYLSKTADREAICLDVATAARGREASSPSAIHGSADLRRSRMPGWVPRLTSHEHQLLQLAYGGWDKPELALLTGVSVSTLRSQLDSILAKLAADDLDEAIDIALSHHIIR
jgi:two-component system, NarL family, nitrate/nitrite response regulator NarL